MMTIPEPLIPNTTIASVAFLALQQTLQQSTQFIRAHDPDAVVYIVQETSLGMNARPSIQHSQLCVDHFTVVMSRTFSGLLVATVHDHSTSAESGKQQAEGLRPKLGHKDGVPKVCSNHGNSQSDQSHGYDVELVFEPEAIANFLRQLLVFLPKNNSLQATLQHGLTLVQPNQSAVQSQFTIQLMTELVNVLDLRPQDVTSFLSLLPSQQAENNQDRVAVETLSEEKQVLHQIAYQNQAEDRTKSEFLATMSHELRTPLTYILGMSATLLRWSAPGSADAISSRQRRYLQNIHEQGEHLLELINDLLDLSQLESGRLGLEFQDFSLSLLIQQSLNVYRKKAQAKGVSLELDSHLTVESDRLTADPHRLQQIISNLLSNAIKFTPQSGKVTVRLSADPHLVDIQVCDTGIGIPEHHRNVIFQKFKQLDSSYHREYEGTGLGLALTKQLVDLHGGWVECDSTVGVGTVFTVKLPRHPFSQTTYPSCFRCPVVSSHPLGRIALLDDNDESGHLVSDMLTAAGYQVVWMLEGLTAITQLEMLQPVLVVINAQLIHGGAGMTNLIQILRKNPMTKRMKILVLSHSIQTNSWSISPTGSVDAIVEMSDPIQPEELLHRVGLLMAMVDTVNAPTA